MAYIGNRPVSGDNNSFRVLDDIKTHTFSFDGSSSSVVSTSDNTITHLGHRLVQGQRVTYTDGTGSAIGGLTDGTVYFVIMNDANSFKLASSASNAAAGTAVNLSALGSGTAHNITVAFDGVNTKFKATFNNGTEADVTRVAQIQISLNNVIQQPQNTPTPTSGFGFESDSVIVFASAPASTVTFWGVLFANNFPTFEISDNEVDNFTGNGSTTDFTLSKSPASNENIIVTIDGVVQHPSDNSTTRAYNTVANTLQFSVAPHSDSDIQVRHIGFAGPDESGGVTAFYGRTGSVFLNNSDNIVVNDAEVTGNLTVQGDTTTLNTTLRNVELLRVDGDDTVAAGIITQRGSGDILKLYDSSTPVFTVKDGGKVGIGTGNPLQKLHVTDGTSANIYIETKNSTTGSTAGIYYKTSSSTASDFFKTGIVLEDDGTSHARGKLHILQNSTADGSNATLSDSVVTFAQDGKVGVNSISPTSRLDVVGDVKITGIVTASSFVGGLPITNGADNRVITATSASAIQGEAGLTFDGTTLSNAGSGFKEIKAATSTNNSSTLRLQNSVKNFSISNVTGGKFAIADGSTQRFIIDGSGNVGVGTVTTSTRFEIEGTAALTNHNQTLLIRDSVSDDATGRGGNIGFGAYVQGTMRTLAAIGALKKNSGTGFDGNLAFYTRRNGVGPVDERMRIHSEGIVEIMGQDDQNNFEINVNSSQFAVHTDDSDGEISLRAQDGAGGTNSKYMTFFTQATGQSAAERLRITESGEVRIADGGKITINTSVSGNYSIQEAFRVDDGNSTADRGLQIFEYHNNGVRWHSLNENLNVTTTGTSYTYTQGNYGGSNMIQMTQGDLRIYSNPSIVSGGTSAITPTERVTITNNGRIGINDPSPANYELDIKKRSDADDAQIRLYNDGTGSTQHTIMRFHIAGTSASNYIYFGDGNDSNAGQIRYHHGNDSLQFYVNANERLRINSDGDVGIGTESPDSKLTVAADSAQAIIELKRTNTNAGGSGSYGAINWTAMDGHSVANISAHGDGDNNGAHLVFRTTSGAANNNPYNAATVERLRIKSNGYVGIGTDDPSSPFQVVSDANNIFQIRSTNRYSTMYMIDTIGSSFIQNDSGHLRFGTGGGANAAGGEDEAFRIKSDGSFGFGTNNSIDERGHIEVASGTCRLKLQTGNAGVTGFVLQTSAIRFDIQAQNNFFQIYDNTVDEERLRITSGGVALFGGLTSQTTEDTSKLAVQGGDSNIGIIQVHAGGGETDGDLSGITFSHGVDNQTARAKAAIALRANGSGNGRGDLCFYVDDTADNNQVSTADEKLRIKSDGNIYTANDQVRDNARLTLSKGYVGISTLLFLHNSNGSGTAAKISSSKGLVFGADVDANSGASESFISFETDNTEKLRIMSGGSIGIRTTTGTNTVNIGGVAGLGVKFHNFTSGNSTFITVESGDKLQSNIGGTGYATWAMGGAEKIRFANNGKVGIGSDDPHRTLVLRTGDGDIHCLDGNGGIYMGTDNTGGFQKNCAIARAGANNYHISGSTPGDLCIAGESGQSMIFGVSPFAGGMDTFLHVSRLRNFNLYGTDYKFHIGSTERFNIKNNGNIGIGTDNATSKVHIGPQNGDTIHHVYLSSGNNDYGFLIDVQDYGNQNVPLRIFNRLNNTDTEVVRITQDGNVGIGTVPDEKFHVRVTSSTATVAKFERTHTNNASIEYKNNTSSMFAGLAGNALGWGVDDDENIGSEPMFIVRRTTGKVGIGIVNPDELLHIFSASGNSKIVLEADNNSANNGIYWVDEGDNTQSEFYYDHGGNKQHLNVNGNGLEIYSKQTSKVTAKIGHGSGYNDVVVPNGKLGVGTDAAGTTLDVFGFLQVKDSTGKLSMQMDGANGNFRVFQSPPGWTNLTYNPNPILGWDFKSGPGDLMYMASGGNTPTSGQMALVVSDNHGFKVGKSGYDGNDFDVDSNNEFFRIDTSGNVLIGTGNVLIGNSLTAVNNETTGTLVVDGGDSNIGGIQVHAGGGENDGDLSGISFSHGNSGTAARPKAAIALRKSSAGYGKGDLCFYVDSANDNNGVSAGDEKLRITNGGRLNLAGNFQFTAANPELEFNNGGPRFRVPAANTLVIHNGGGLGSTNNEVARIHSDGSIGISSATTTSNATGVIKYMSGTSRPDNAVGGITIRVDANTISGDITLPRFGHIMAVTSFTDIAGTNYPQPSGAGLIYVDVGPSKSLTVITQNNVSGNLRTVSSTITDINSASLTANNVTFMPGSGNGTIRIANKWTTSPTSTKITFYLTFM